MPARSGAREFQAIVTSGTIVSYALYTVLGTNTWLALVSTRGGRASVLVGAQAGDGPLRPTAVPTAIVQVACALRWMLQA